MLVIIIKLKERKLRFDRKRTPLSDKPNTHTFLEQIKIKMFLVVLSDVHM